MALLSKLLDPQKELDLYLVEQGMKPCARIWPIFTQYIPRFRQYLRESSLKSIELEHNFVVGPTLEIVNDIVRFPNQIGYLLGYPSVAVQSFCQPAEGGIRWDLCAMLVQLARARDEGIEIPSWIPYLSHIPEPFDLVAGQMCIESQKVGLVREEFVRARNPNLASRLDAYPLFRELPLRWEIEHNVYVPFYENGKFVFPC